MADCPSLQHANESRRRAWKEMSSLRGMMEAAGAPIERPRDFEHEGAALRAALSWLLLEHADRMNLLKRCFVDFRLTVEHEQGPVRYEGARAVMEYLLKTAHLPAGVVEEMRKLSGYKERDMETIRKANAGVARLPTKLATAPHPPPPPSEAPD